MVYIYRNVAYEYEIKGLWYKHTLNQYVHIESQGSCWDVFQNDMLIVVTYVLDSDGIYVTIKLLSFSISLGPHSVPMFGPIVI